MSPLHGIHSEPVDPALSYVADVGGSHVTAAVVERGSEPRVLERAAAKIATHGHAHEILESIASTLRRVAPDARQWTIALPGPFEYEQGVGSFDGVGKFAALAGLNLRVRLNALLGAANSELRFVNDAVAYGIGEWYVSSRRPRRFVCITLGTGIGSAFLDRGRPVESGPDVPPHGWAHLLEINGAPLEDSVSTRAIQSRYVLRGGERVTVREIAERAREGEVSACAVLESAMFDLGAALRPCVVRFQASELVIGGSMARSWDVLGASFERGVRQDMALPLSVRPSHLFDDAPLIGAAMFN
jgi:glucokinase